MGNFTYFWTFPLICFFNSLADYASQCVAAEETFYCVDRHQHFWFCYSTNADVAWHRQTWPGFWTARSGPTHDVTTAAQSLAQAVEMDSGTKTTLSLLLLTLQHLQVTQSDFKDNYPAVAAAQIPSWITNRPHLEWHKHPDCQETPRHLSAAHTHTYKA